MTSPAAPPHSTLTTRIHTRLASHQQLLQVPAEAQLARTTALLLEDDCPDAS